MRNVTRTETGHLALVIVWDGLRPDFVAPGVTPTLHALATGGVWFDSSHCAYPSETRVNATALATGCYPGRTGITANTFWAPGFDPTDPAALLNTGDHTQLARLAEIDPPLVRVPALADAVIAAGGAAAVASSGSPGAALLQAGDGAPILNFALLRPDTLASHVMQRFGSCPPDSMPATGRSDWVTRGLLDHLLPDLAAPAVRAGRPALLHWWLTDPDHTAHRHGLGAPETLQSLRENDARLAALMARLDELGLTQQTDVLLTSDHGFSTAGPRRWAGRTLPWLVEHQLEDELGADVVTAGQGGAISLGPRAAGRAAEIVAWLQQQDWVGAVFARDDGPAAGAPGTLPLSLAWNGHVGPRAPDIRFSFDWTGAANEHGVAGSVLAGSGRGASHGSASPFDMRNSLFGWGPRFQRGLRSSTPAGIIDVTPTMRHLLGLPSAPADGRVLSEALADGGPPPEVHQDKVVTSAGSYRQEAHVPRIGNTSYLSSVAVSRAGGTPG